MTLNLKNLIKIFMLSIVLPMAIVLIINKLLVFQIIVPSDSMYPTIKEGDRILVTRVYDTTKLMRGDIIVLYSDELKTTIVKRLVGMPGDFVSMKDGQVFINKKN